MLVPAKTYSTNKIDSYMDKMRSIVHSSPQEKMEESITRTNELLNTKKAKQMEEEYPAEHGSTAADFIPEEVNKIKENMNIYEKIAKIQDEVEIRKSADNPYFHSKYATYEGVLNAIHDAMRKYGLVHVHGFEPSPKDGCITVITVLADAENKSEVNCKLEIPLLKNDPQSAGSAITYAKRYSLLAILGLGTEDDDGNSSSEKTTNRYYDESPDDYPGPEPIVEPKTTQSPVNMVCPKCGSEMWDNRGKKTNPKAPDFKCKNQDCGHAIWPPKK